MKNITLGKKFRLYYSSLSIVKIMSQIFVRISEIKEIIKYTLSDGPLCILYCKVSFYLKWHVCLLKTAKI